MGKHRPGSPAYRDRFIGLCAGAKDLLNARAARKSPEAPERSISGPPTTQPPSKPAKILAEVRHDGPVAANHAGDQALGEQRGAACPRDKERSAQAKARSVRSPISKQRRRHHRSSSASWEAPPSTHSMPIFPACRWRLTRGPGSCARNDVGEQLL
jgi:hypothetical protein